MGIVYHNERQYIADAVDAAFAVKTKEEDQRLAFDIHPYLSTSVQCLSYDEVARWKHVIEQRKTSREFEISIVNLMVDINQEHGLKVPRKDYGGLGFPDVDKMFLAKSMLPKYEALTSIINTLQNELINRSVVERDKMRATIGNDCRNPAPSKYSFDPNEDANENGVLNSRKDQQSDVTAGGNFPTPLMNLKPNGCQYLYTELTKDGHFIPKCTNREHFNYVFGGGVCPNDFAPLHWNVSKRALSELVILILNTSAVPRPIKRAAKDLFISPKTKKTIGELCNPQKNDPSNDCSVLQSIANGINTSSA